MPARRRKLETLRRAIEAWPEVDSVQLDRDWLVRFNAILELMRRAVLITAILLAAGVIAVVGNTIRLEIRSRAAEIEVTQLVGGSRAFVRRPFLYTGVLYGLIAAAIAWGIVGRRAHRAGAQRPDPGRSLRPEIRARRAQSRGSLDPRSSRCGARLAGRCPGERPRDRAQWSWQWLTANPFEPIGQILFVKRSFGALGG